MSVKKPLPKPPAEDSKKDPNHGQTQKNEQTQIKTVILPHSVEDA